MNMNIETKFASYLLSFRILVGAPLGKNLQPKTNRSGALFKCPITQNPNDCTQVITDGRRCKFLRTVKDVSHLR